MPDYKNIEELYKKHSESHKVMPPPDVWNKIENSLNNKQKEKRIVWLRIAGVAASLLIMVSLTTWLWVSDISTKNIPLSENALLNKENIEVEDAQQSSENNNSTDLEKEKNIPVSDKQPEKNKIAYFSEDKHSFVVYSGNENPAKPEKIESASSIQLNNKLAVSDYFYSDKIEIEKSQKKQTVLISAENHADAIFGAIIKNEPKKNRPKIEIGGAYSPVYSFRQAPENNSASMQTMSMSGKAMPDEQGILYGGGALNVNVKMNKKWSVESGARYTRMGQKITPGSHTNMFAMMSLNNNENNTLGQVPLNNSMGNINIDTKINSIPDFDDVQNSPEIEFSPSPSRAPSPYPHYEEATSSSKLELNVDYLEIPLSMRYYVIDNKITLSMLAGVSANFLINNNAYLLNDDLRERIGEVSDIAGLSMSTHAGLSFSLPIVGQLSLQVEPRVNYFLNSINKGDYQFRPYSFGVYSGIRYKFGNR